MMKYLEEILQKLREITDSYGIVPALITLSTFLGFLSAFIIVLFTGYLVLRCLRLYFFKRYCCRTNLKKNYGQWAVVTGATDGIGLAMAKEMARRGFSIIIIGRNEEKLARTRTSLLEEDNVGQVETVKIDLAIATPEDYEQVKSQIDPDNREIGVLINNAGMCEDNFRRFANFSIDSIRRMVNVNVMSNVNFTHMIIPGMLNRQRGMIINVSSVANYAPSPYMSAYCATKAFISSLSKTLQMEYANHPIDIVNLTPGYVYTNLVTQSTDLSSKLFFMVNADSYAKSALSAAETRTYTMTGCFMHDITTIGMVIGDCLGITEYYVRWVLNAQAKNAKLSPIMRRKKVSNEKGTESERLSRVATKS